MQPCPPRLCPGANVPAQRLAHVCDTVVLEEMEDTSLGNLGRTDGLQLQRRVEIENKIPTTRLCTLLPRAGLLGSSAQLYEMGKPCPKHKPT